MMTSTRLLFRPAAALFRRTLLSPAFSLNEAWSGRHNELDKLGLGGDYEWIASVQKKFIGSGVGSAVDVDAAVCIAEHQDQVNDVLDLIYKLRHSPSAAEFLASTEYAIVRLLLKHDPDRLIDFADDPINYGIFFNHHTACLAIDHFLNKDDIPRAARLATWVMLQEMLDNQLLNQLSLYTVARWAELDKTNRTLPMPKFLDEDEEINDEDVKTVKFPWLKNARYDDHFDIADPDRLVGKSLLWLGRESKLIGETTRKSAMLLGLFFMNDFFGAAKLASPSILHSVKSQIRDAIEKESQSNEGAPPSTQQQKLLDAFGPSEADENDRKLSEEILKSLKKNQAEQEKLLSAQQINEFSEWTLRRKELINSQAERALLKVKLEDIAEELKKLEEREEKLSFFENRLGWEKKAEDNDQIKPVEGKPRVTSV